MSILAIAQPTYKPAMRVISAITNAKQAAITTTFDHLYVTGTVVRLHIPSGYGLVQANELTGAITVTGSTTFTVDIDTSLFDTYSAPASYPFNQQYAVVVPIGEVNSMLTAAVVNSLPYSG